MSTSDSQDPGSASPQPTSEVSAKLRAALVSVGADKETISKLLSSSMLGSVVVPLYARGTVTDEFNDLWLIKLPEFVRWFTEEFPDGRVRWDSEFEDTSTGKSRPVIRVNFNYQEGDQGDHWSYRPTVLEEESYHKKLDELKYKNGKKVEVRSVIQGK